MEWKYVGKSVTHNIILYDFNNYVNYITMMGGRWVFYEKSNISC